MRSIELPDRPDEVSYSDYLAACNGLERCAKGLAESGPDEAVEHWLIQLTQHAAIIWSFIGSNMTARNATLYERITAALQAAKDNDPLVETVARIIMEQAATDLLRDDEARRVAQRILRQVSSAVDPGRLTQQPTS